MMCPRQVLVVEDSDEDFETVQDAARRSGVVQPIVRARSGAECLRLLTAGRDSPGGTGRSDGLTVLMLLDLNTPGDDGRDVLRQVRRDAALAALPVVVISASANARDLQFCYAHGANAYHVKPVDHALHLKVLQSLFGYWLGAAVLPA
jgi:CheY-like chemotaxis protein